MDIVVGAVSSMVDALPVKLGKLLEQEYALLAGVRDDVCLLQTELGGYIRRMRSRAPTKSMKNTINTKIIQLSLSATP
jgi:hypothetical protein